MGTKGDGTPCAANPLKTGDYCISHDKEAGERAGFGGSQPGAGRPKNPRAVDVLRERLEEQIDRVLNPLFDALEAETQAIALGAEDAEPISVPDHRIRLAAVREILDRSYGKPTQATEISGPDGGPLQIVDTSDPATRKALHELLGHRPAASGS